MIGLLLLLNSWKQKFSPYPQNYYFIIKTYVTLEQNPDGTSRTGSKKSKDKHKDKDNNKIKEKEKVIDKALEHNGADCVNEKNSENLVSK